MKTIEWTGELREIPYIGVLWEGEKRDLPDDLAENLIKAGLAKLVKPKKERSDE